MRCYRRDQGHTGDLPAVEAVPAGCLAATQGGSDKPEDGEDHRRHPQEVYRESGAEEEQDYEENQ
jgi:hypothetical protein